MSLTFFRSLAGWKLVTAAVGGIVTLGGIIYLLRSPKKDNALLQAQLSEKAKEPARTSFSNILFMTFTLHFSNLSIFRQVLNLRKQ